LDFGLYFKHQNLSPNSTTLVHKDWVGTELINGCILIALWFVVVLFGWWAISSFHLNAKLGIFHRSLKSIQE
jgi:hypothetical protein